MSCNKVIMHDSFRFVISKIASRMRREIIEVMPRCPDCGMTLDICDINTDPTNRTFDPEEKSMVFCPEELNCGYQATKKKTVEKFLAGIGFNEFLITVYRFMRDSEIKRQRKRIKSGCGGSRRQ